MIYCAFGEKCENTQGQLRSSSNFKLNAGIKTYTFLFLFRRVDNPNIYCYNNDIE